ncbi:peptide chain release factor 1 [Candidatus Synchoanobacter obligatus]|uniref:Peptide chain release factor 1 n=1 Tax=Candidatus Synchoanobacter obligatus TaxID=2919597 RepID=A0ABT1L4L2_9GAMM|nr:peptide chain release factor 1 [Candidatus Synchoanobacter obligatus]MCP8352105.1 peptide chain release factor 1 [Candidatus Synchoanobacter obligatus]
MQKSIRAKLEAVMLRHQELEAEQLDPEAMSDHKAFERVGKELHGILPVVELYQEYCGIEKALAEAVELLEGDDEDMAALAEEEKVLLNDQLAECEQALMVQLLPKDPDDDKNIYLEIRAGAGGDEASLFVADLLRMYLMYADSQRWKYEVMSQSPSSQGGYKEIVYALKGKEVYRMLKYESGTHRVQRVPATESQGRIHTSTVTVAILPQVEQIGEVAIQPQDLRIDTYRSSGAGGQHVNTTDSAVRITHIPTQTVVECQDERSQHKNKAKAMALLNAKILQQQQSAQQQELSQERSIQVGTGERSERIRTYNFPQGRMTDHRINLTLYRLDEVMEGGLAELIEVLIREDKAKKLAGLVDE